MNSRMFIDPTAFSHEAGRWLDRLSQKAEGIRSYRFSEILTKWRQTIDERIDAPYTIVVCGEFKRGKSSFINALLGDDIAPVDVIPETVTYNTISYGAHTNEAVLKGGRRLKLSDEELKRENLERIMAEMGCRIEQLTLKRPIEAIRDIAIVDTPGLNDIIDVSDELMKNTLAKADAIVYVMTADSPLSMTEQSFIRSVILPNPTLSVMIVCNKIDLMPIDQLDRVEEAIQRRCQRFLPGQKIYLLSAYAERLRQKGRQSNRIEDEDLLNTLFNDFRSALESDITSRKEAALLGRVERMMANCAAELEEEINVIRSVADDHQNAELSEGKHMADSLKKSNEALSAFLKKINARLDAMELSAEKSLDDLFVKLRREADTLDSFDEADIERYYPFYCVDMVQEELSRQMEQNQDDICEMLQTTPELSFLHLPQLSVPDMRFDLDCRVWTKGDTVSYFGGYAPGMLSQLLVTYVGGMMREKEVAGQTVSLKAKILDIQPQFRRDVLQSVRDLYKQFKKDISNQFSDYLNDREAQLIERQQEVERLRKLSDAQLEQLCRMANELLQDIEAMKTELMD